VGLFINTNVAAINAARNLRNSTKSLNHSLERLSTGLRINHAKDDAAGLAISESLRTQVRGSVVAQRNCQDGISMLQTAEGALVETTNMIQRMRELAVQSANGTLGGDVTLNANRVALDNEVQQLKEHINAIAAQTDFNGIAVLNTVGTITIQMGYKGGQTLTIPTQSATSTALGLGAAGAVLSVSTMVTAVAAIGLLDTALTSVSSLRALFGASMNRLEFTINTLGVMEENASAADSVLRDADIARETVAFTRNQILVSSGTSVLAQSNVIPQTALQLLGG
jgi:flagellin